MNITYQPIFKDKPVTCSVAEFVAESMSRWETHGILEDTDARARNTAHAFGRLIEILATKGILDVADVLTVTESDWNAKSATLTPPAPPTAVCECCKNRLNAGSKVVCVDCVSYLNSDKP